ncbi:MAG: sulfatase [Candidatus Binatia bacterium]
MLTRGVRTGTVFGLAAVGAEFASVAWFVLQNRITPGLELLARGVLASAILGAVLGAAGAPLLSRRGGRFWHVLALAVAWAAIMVQTGPAATSFRVMVASYPAVALVVLLIGRGLRRRWPGVPGVLGPALLLAVVVGPTVWLRLTTAASRPTVVAAAPAGAPDVVVVVLDTVRADHVSAYGYARPTTPTFDALAQSGALFLDATAPSTWSLPSHASLFTGLFPSSHGAHDEHRFLEPGPPTLAEALAAAGWDTRCFTANAWISDNLGLTRGFAWQDEAWRTGDVGRAFTSTFRFLDWIGLGPADKGGAQVAANFEAWTASRPAGDRPAFAFLNFIEAHFPYHQLPDAYLRRFTPAPRAELRAMSLRLFAAQFGGEPLDPAEAAAPATAMYDGGVLYADALLGRVVEALRRRGTLDRTVLVVLADHGELLGERGEFGHGHSLFEAVTHVPLLVRFPPRIAAGARVGTPVSTVGVFATVLDLVGLVPATRLQVGSLVPVVAGEPGGGPVLSERFANTVLHSEEKAVHSLMVADERYRSYRSGTWKRIETGRQKTTFLFDLAADPGEQHDLAAARPDDLERLSAELAMWQRAIGLPALDAPLGSRATPVLDPAARERLRALGYAE